MTLREVVTAVIAGVFVATYCSIVLVEAFNNRPYNVPGEFFAIVVSVVSFFFGQHAATNGAYAAGVASAQVAATALSAAKVEPAQPTTGGTP